MVAIPVNPDVLAWARQERNLTIAQAAERIGVGADDLRALEAGVETPTLGVLRKIATGYQINFASLLMPAPLPAVQPLKDYRTLGGRDAALSPEALVQIHDVREAQKLLAEIFEEVPELRPHLALPAASTRDRIEDVAATQREFLGVSIDAQLGWQNETEAFRRWRTAIERTGVFVYLLKIPIDDCRGFSLRTDGIAAIGVSDAEVNYRPKIFTLLHEYIHVVIGETGLSDQNPQNRIEKFCNDVASAILMPVEALRRILAFPPEGQRKEWTEPEIRYAVARLKVSKYALALRLEDIGVAPVGFYGRKVALWQAQDAMPRRRTGGQSRWGERNLRRLGGHHAEVVLRALDHGAIDFREARDLLGMKPKHFSDLRTALREHRAVFG